MIALVVATDGNVSTSTAVELQDMREVSHPVITQDEIREMLEHVCIH